MEGGALGLNATFLESPTTGEYEETSSSNNIDSHMMKNTEWGAIAMLSASDYGAGNEMVKNDYVSATKTYGLTASTTGNYTGVFGMNRGAHGYEMMAAGVISKMQMYYNKYLINASVRYVDNYVGGTDRRDFTRYIPGDATYETKPLSNSLRESCFVSDTHPLFTRDFEGIFSMYGDEADGYSVRFGSGGSRAAIWVGDGI